jgi:hypothetical protein
MGGQRWLVAGVVAILLGASGCVSCGSKGYGLAYEAGPNCDLPECQRNQVYVFAVAGLNPAAAIALDDLRLKLNEKGFAKVATGQVVYADWMAGEMRRIHAEQPDAVFVVVGVNSAGSTAAKLVQKATADGVPVSAVVFLDADGKTPLSGLGVRTLLVGPGVMAGVESVVIPDASGYTLLTDPRTVDAVTRVLSDAAAGVALPADPGITEWSYPHAPEMRPTVDMGKSVEWAYLFDQPGNTIRPIDQPLPVAVSRPATTTTTATRPAPTGPRATQPAWWP